jgi:hypothetical protein
MKTNFTIFIFLALLTTTLQSQPTQGLVAYYPFNGNANDESGNGINGTLHNVTLTEDRFGNSGKAYYFLGNSTSYIHTITSPLLNLSGNATLVAWIKGNGTLNNIARVIGTTDDGVEIGTNSNGTANSNFSYSGTNWFNIVSNKVINDNQWHFVSVVINANQGKLFVDAIKVKDTSSTSAFTMTSPGYVSIGRHPIYTSRAFTGSIDDIRIYNRALNESELQVLFNEVVGVEYNNQIVPCGFQLFQNYPNPFNPSTKIQYVIPEHQFITLKVYDILGKEIATLENEEKDAGYYSVDFNSSNLATGVYIYKIKAGNFVQSKKMLLLK